jgi:tetratricopeptide (TPR) repeat protein
MHEAFSNWGAALAAQAKLKGNTPEADRLFAEASQKYAAAVRIKSDKHEAFSNWGNALLAQAKLKGNTPEADRLFAEAAHKYAEAVRIKPDNESAHFNLGCLAALLGQVRECCESLARWKQYKDHPKKSDLDLDADFDRVRNAPEFQAFRESLPE